MNMKKLIPILGLAAVITACNTNPEIKTDSAQAVQQTITAPDTTGMAAFNAWKAQNELSSLSAYQQTQETVASQPKVKTIVKRVPVASTPQSKPASRPASTTSEKPAPVNSGSGDADNGTVAGTGSGETTPAEKKEGWSKAAKGAVIGGVTGAAGGAVINKKNRVLGAVIGGVVGAAGGYGIGRTMDKKDGRIDYSTIIN